MSENKAEYPKTKRNQIKRVPKRAQYDQQTIHQIIDEALLCHVSFVENEQPFIIPTIHARENEILYLHGAPASRLLKHVQAGHPVCVAITLLDGIVFARSVFDHSMNYRSVVLFGKGRVIDSDAEKTHALKIITEHVARGRWEEARLPNRKELDATAVVAIEIESASAKIRTGPPVDNEEDYALPIWAGVVPLKLQAGEPIPDPKLQPAIAIAQSVSNYSR